MLLDSHKMLRKVEELGRKNLNMESLNSYQSVSEHPIAWLPETDEGSNQYRGFLRLKGGRGVLSLLKKIQEMRELIFFRNSHFF